MHRASYCKPATAERSDPYRSSDPSGLLSLVKPTYPPPAFHDDYCTAACGLFALRSLLFTISSVYRYLDLSSSPFPFLPPQVSAWYLCSDRHCKVHWVGPRVPWASSGWSRRSCGGYLRNLVYRARGEMLEE